MIIPVYLILWAKVVSGVTMFIKRFKKSAFLKYYVVSWSFYWSFTT